MALRRMNPDDFFNAVEEKQKKDMPYYDKYLDSLSMKKGSDREQLCPICNLPFVKGYTQHQRVCPTCRGQLARGTLRDRGPRRTCRVCGRPESYTTRLGYENRPYLCREHAGGWRAKKLAAQTCDID